MLIESLGPDLRRGDRHYESVRRTGELEAKRLLRAPFRRREHRQQFIQGLRFQFAYIIG